MDDRMAVLEGWCPTCEVELVLDVVGGSKEFVEEFHRGNARKNVWKGKVHRNQGSLDLHCPKCKHEYYEERNEFGDWG